MTHEERAEYLRCKHDIVYFFEKYILLIERTDFTCTEEQLKFFSYIHLTQSDFVEPRQTGMTTAAIGFALHHTIFNEKTYLQYIRHNVSNTIDVLAIAHRLLPNIPTYFYHMYNKDYASVIFTNGSSINFCSMQNVNPLRGRKISVLLNENLRRSERDDVERLFGHKVLKRININCVQP